MFRWLSFSIEDIAYIHFTALLYYIRYFSHVLNALKRGKEQILLFHRRRYKLPIAEYNCLRKNSTTSSCRGSCERETKQSKRQRMAPACVQLSSEHQQPFTRERVPWACAGGHTRSHRLILLSKRSSAHELLTSILTILGRNLKGVLALLWLVSFWGDHIHTELLVLDWQLQLTKEPAVDLARW